MSEAFARAEAATPAAGATRPAPQTNQQSRPAARGAGVMEINNRLRRPISRNQTGELTAAYARELTDQLEASMGPSFRDSYSLHILDNTSNLLPLSAILVCFTVSHANVNYCGVFQLVVEGSGSRLANRFVPINGQNIEIDVVAGDVVEGTQWARVQTFLTEAFGAKMQFLNAGAMVLPVELSPDDKVHLHRVLFDATQALYTVMENDVTTLEAPLTIKDIDAGTSLSATLDYSPPALDDDVGMPVRSDISIILRASLNNTGGAIPHEQVRELTRVDGYIEPVYNEPGQQPWGAPPISQRYNPRFVITNMTTETDAVTPELQLLALSTATLLSKNMAWGGTFRPRYNTQGVDLHDIGAIGYEVNLTGDPTAKPDRVDTKADSFSNASLYALLSQTFNDAVIYSMDIDEVGPLAWLHQNFIAAANGDAGAYTAIIEAANRLTNGTFQNFWNGGPIAVDDLNRVHLGYYTGLDGVRRDIRDVDYLALLNLLGEKDMGSVINWSKTFDDTSIPLEIRLEQRAKLLKGLLPGLQIKGYARRITWYPEFINALNSAAAAAGLVIRPNNLITDFTGQGTRHTYQAAQFGVGPQAAGGVFSYGAPAAFGGRGMAGPFFGRYNQG